MNVVHGLLVDHHVPLLGLALSVGQAHIGPLFYYLLALPMCLGQILVGFLDPTAGVALLGLFQVGTVYLIYRLGRLVEAPWLGLCAAGLYATSGLVVYWSRFLWPNCAPFFVVLALYALVALAQGRPRCVLLLAGSLAAMAQLQPTAVLLIPVAAIWLLAVRPRLTLRQALLALGLVVLLFAPVIVYDLTHHLAETTRLARVRHGRAAGHSATEWAGARCGRIGAIRVACRRLPDAVRGRPAASPGRRGGRGRGERRRRAATRPACPPAHRLDHRLRGGLQPVSRHSPPALRRAAVSAAIPGHRVAARPGRHGPIAGHAAPAVTSATRLVAAESCYAPDPVRGDVRRRDRSGERQRAPSLARPFRPRPVPTRQPCSDTG